MPTNALAADARRQKRFFGADGLSPLWVAEPYVELAPEIRAALTTRAETGWYGYEIRPRRLHEAFWAWAKHRHEWDEEGLTTLVSPSVGTSIGVLIDRLTAAGDGIILQPPVFTDFKPLIRSANRTIVRNPLVLRDGRYTMDHDALEQLAAEPTTKLLILCNPHNPVGRVWTEAELSDVAAICAAHDVFVIADEIHADLALFGNAFTPFARVATGSGVRWAATHGPIKTFGLAGICDTLLITADDAAAKAFRAAGRQLHLNRNNVFGLAAFEAAYGDGAAWLDTFLRRVERNVTTLDAGLEEGLRLIPPEGTYLAWLDLRRVGLEPKELAAWLVEAGLALSPGHWFGREGAGFARMTIAVEEPELANAIARLHSAIR